MALPRGFRDVALLCEIVTFLHLEETDALPVLGTPAKLYRHHIEDHIDDIEQEECEGYVDKIDRVDPVDIHGFVFMRHYHDVEQDEKQRNGEGDTPHAGRFQKINEISEKAVEEPRI